mmetsp:Transcript_21361/g.44473  ORF Transcript_21361/g.44473 Transcript_21361/m.44473 type:complete len:665 (+) Transcript_21361:216-2210(+)
MSAVYEVSEGGFDLTEAPPDAKHLDHKTAGTEAFKLKNFDVAVTEYSAALRLAPESDDSFKSVVLCNRSAAYGGLEKFSKALEDAKLSLKYDPENVKAYYRVATYSFQLSDWVGAISASEKGLKIDPDNKPLQRLKIKAKREKKAAPVPMSSSNKNYVSLYPEKTEKHGSARDLLRQLKFELGSGKASKTHTGLDGMFARLIDPQKFQQTIFPGLSPEARKNAPKTLIELLENPMYEEEMAVNGIPDARKKAHSVLENVKRKGAKQNQFMDAATEASLWPQIMQEAIAHQVVEVVNRVNKKEHSNKGISAAVVCAVACAIDINIIHNAEGIDIPINEQFLPMVESILGGDNTISRGARGEDVSNGGDEEDDGFLPEESLVGLLVVPGLEDSRMKEIEESRSFDPSSPGDEDLGIGSGWFVLDNFLGEDAHSVLDPAIRSDCKRLARNDRMTPIPVMKKAGEGTPGGILSEGHGKIAWVSGNELSDKYAAIAEIITSLRSLTSELNSHALSTYKKNHSNEEINVFKVAKPFDTAVAVTSFGKGDRQTPRIDSGGGETEDVGHAVSCLYFCGDVGVGGTTSAGGAKRSGALRLTNLSDKKSVVIDHKKDRLVCWRSKDVENEILEVLNPDENLFSVRLWFHGCITSKENVMLSIGRLKDANLQGKD